MIQDLRVFNVSVRRHLVSHARLREFCVLLYGCRRELGDVIACEDWRRFAQPLWRFHNRAVAVPLPLEHAAVLNTEEAQGIDREAQRVRKRILASRQLVDRLCDALGACRRADLDPIGARLRAVLEGIPDGTSILLPWDDATLLSAVRDALSLPSGISLSARVQQGEQREHLRRSGSIIVLGKLANIDPVLLRAPLCDRLINLVLYDWTSDRNAGDLAGPSLGDLLGGSPSLGRFATWSDDLAPSPDDTPSLGPHEQAIIREERPFVVPDLDLFDLARPQRTPIEDSGEPLPSVMLLLADERSRSSAILLELDDPVLVLRRTDEGWSRAEVRAADMLTGDVYVQKTDPKDQDLIERLARESLIPGGNLERLEAQQLEWKSLLAECLKRLGPASVTSGIASYCEGWQPGEDRVIEWARSGTMGPQQRQAFRAVCRFLAIPEAKAKEHWRAMRAIHNAHVAAGKELSQRVLNHVVEQCRAGSVNTDGATRFEIGGRAAMVYPVKLVARQISRVPRSSLGFVFPLNDLDVEELTESPCL
jgi:hypothetical protein